MFLYIRVIIVYMTFNLTRFKKLFRQGVIPAAGINLNYEHSAIYKTICCVRVIDQFVAGPAENQLQI